MSLLRYIFHDEEALEDLVDYSTINADIAVSIVQGDPHLGLPKSHQSIWKDIFVKDSIDRAIIAKKKAFVVLIRERPKMTDHGSKQDYNEVRRMDCRFRFNR
jgi:hypothetical protein